MTVAVGTVAVLVMTDVAIEVTIWVAVARACVVTVLERSACQCDARLPPPSRLRSTYTGTPLTTLVAVIVAPLPRLRRAWLLRFWPLALQPVKKSCQSRL